MRHRLVVGLGVALSVWIASPSASQVPARSAGSAVSTLTVFAGTETGLWRSTTWGYEWERVAVKELDDLGAVRFILPLGPRVLVGGEGGLYVSDNFGDTWTRNPQVEKPLCALVSRYPTADPTLFIGTPNGLVKSPDAGVTFAPTPLSGTPVLRLVWPGPALIVATGNGVRISDDSAVSFRDPPVGLPGGEVRAVAPSSFFIHDPVVFAGMSRRGVFRSTDGGGNWKPSGLAERVINDLVWLGPFLYAATDAGLFRSDDAGDSWTLMGDAKSKRPLTQLLFPHGVASGAEAFLGTDSGILWTGDGGGNWLVSGLEKMNILCLGTFPPPEQSSQIKR